MKNINHSSSESKTKLFGTSGDTTILLFNENDIGADDPRNISPKTTAQSIQDNLQDSTPTFESLAKKIRLVSKPGNLK